MPGHDVELEKEHGFFQGGELAPNLAASLLPAHGRVRSSSTTDAQHHPIGQVWGRRREPSLPEIPPLP